MAAVSLAKRYGRPAVPFARKYTAADIELLVEMYRANEDVWGVAIVQPFQFRGSWNDRLALPRSTGLARSQMLRTASDWS